MAKAKSIKFNYSNFSSSSRAFIYKASILVCVKNAQSENKVVDY
jgi:hypothetical protein